MKEKQKEHIIELFQKPEQNAVYQALLIWNSSTGTHIITDEHLYTTFEKALTDAFTGKAVTRELIRSDDESVDFRIRKKYLDNTGYISARITQKGEIKEVWSDGIPL